MNGSMPLMGLADEGFFPRHKVKGRKRGSGREREREKERVSGREREREKERVSE